MKISIKEFVKKVKPIRDTPVYSVHDLIFLEHLNVSMTVLHPEKETKGHSHENQEEVYVFLEGNGEIQLGEKKFDVEKDDFVLIKKGLFHKVFNMGNKDLIFLCIFEKYEGRGK